MYVSSTDYPNDYPYGKIFEFNSLADESEFKDIKTIKDSLVLQEERSFGKIYKRNDNNEYWYLSTDDSIFRLITTEKLDLFIKWEKEDLVPTNNQFDILSSVGGLPSSKYSIEPSNIRFPAHVVTHNGQSIDLCIICFSKAPPFQRYFKNIILFSEVLEINPSELALSHELRLLSTLADEIRMGFYPFMVKTKTGHLLTYNGITQFASTGEIKGNDILSQVKFSYDKFDKIQDVSYDKITFVIGKWDENMDVLFKKYRESLDSYDEKIEANSNPKFSFWQKVSLVFKATLRTYYKNKS